MLSRRYTEHKASSLSLSLSLSLSRSLSLSLSLSQRPQGRSGEAGRS
eukprot:COSAG06_NODE_51400_length_312_cov_0.985915_1_plen_46_part_10